MKAQKARLTITLPEDVLQLVDTLVDKKSIRNRSHAIEHVLRTALSTRVQTAVLLAGGRADQEPSALKRINNRPLIHYTLEHLKAHGFTRLVVCGGTHTAALKAALGSDSAWGIHVVYVTGEKTPLGTAGVLKLAQPQLGQLPFLVLHGDVLTTLNLTEFIAFHFEQRTLATMAVKPRMSEEKYGQVFLQGNKIIQFLPIGRSEGISIVNAGVYVVQPEALEHLRSGVVSNLESHVFPQLAAQRELSAYIFQGLWHDISSTSNYAAALQQWSKERPPVPARPAK
jgi:mannose-1-phosphate guanylyltransferase